MIWAGIAQMLIAAGGIAPTLVTHVTPGSFTETIPAGAGSCVVEVWGPSNIGGTGAGTGCAATAGGGGGAGGYGRTSLGVVGGLTFSYTVGAANGALSSVSSGTQAITTITANGGAVGGNAPAGLGGAGGTCSGGTQANTTGGAGNPGSGIGGSGGSPIAGVNASLGNPGGHGGLSSGNTGRTGGQVGGVAFFYT
jgi:hypothetical protein